MVVSRDKIWFLAKIEILDLIFDFWPTFVLLPKINDNFDKIGLLTKISTFDQNFDLRPKIRLLTKISMFDENFNFRPKFRLVTKISTFDQNFD